MTWYNPTTWFANTEDKANPVQTTIAQDEGTTVTTDAKISYDIAYRDIEVINRGVSMIVSACAGLDYDVKEKLHEGARPNIRKNSLHQLLNVRPNPYQSSQEMRSLIFTDFLLDGNAFMYYDGQYLYHLPAKNVEIIPDSVKFISKFKYSSSKEDMLPHEIVYFKDISINSIYRGTSRLSGAERSITLVKKMQAFQEEFFNNGASFKMVLVTDNTLGESAKARTIANIVRTNGNTVGGGTRPVILDSGLKPVPMSGATNTFKDLDFDVSLKTHQVKILEALGVPPVLLDGGNQANISPNLRLFYLETVLPIVRKYVSAIELFTGYDVDVVTSNVSALQPELNQLGQYYQALVNGGIMKPNEAREELRLGKDEDPASDKLRIPANIAGSAANPSVGGAPKKPQNGSQQ